MSDETGHVWRGSLFQSTSAFGSPWVPTPEELESLAAPEQTIEPSPREELEEIASLLEQAIVSIEDSKGGEALGPIEIALELARKYA